MIYPHTKSWYIGNMVEVFEVKRTIIWIKPRVMQHDNMRKDGLLRTQHISILCNSECQLWHKAPYFSNKEWVFNWQVVNWQSLNIWPNVIWKLFDLYSSSNDIYLMSINYFIFLPLLDLRVSLLWWHLCCCSLDDVTSLL